MNTSSTAASASNNPKLRIASWVLQLLAASAFLAAGLAKLAGVPMMVVIFEQIGLGQWFRIATGLVEITGAIALLVPVSAAFGGLLLATTMIFGVVTHIFVIGGNPAPAIVLLLITASVAYLRRDSITKLVKRG